MLTVNDLNQNATLKELPEEVKAAIAELSKNDEQVVINARVKKIYSDIDKEIEGVVGTSKPGGVKTYDWNVQVLKDLQGKASKSTTLETKIKELEDAKAKLEKQVKDGGGDPALKARIGELETKLSDESGLVTSLREQLKTEQATHKSEIEKRDKAAYEDRVRNLWTEAQTGMKFKDEKLIPATVRDSVIADKIRILNGKYKVDFGKSETDPVVFRDGDGNIVRNTANNQNPYTANELLAEQLKDIILQNRHQGGAGGKGKPGSGGGSTFNLNGAKNQIEANQAIHDYLVTTEGLVSGTEDFSNRQVELAKEANVRELPLR